MNIADNYLRREEKNMYPKHTLAEVPIIRVCKFCRSRKVTYCFDCGAHFCRDCYSITHHIVHKVITIEKKGYCIYKG